MATVARQLKTKSSNIAADAYEANGVGATLSVLENQGVMSYIVGSVKFTIIVIWAGIVGIVGGIAYLKEQVKQPD